MLSDCLATASRRSIGCPASAVLAEPAASHRHRILSTDISGASKDTTDPTSPDGIAHLPGPAPYWPLLWDWARPAGRSSPPLRSARPSTDSLVITWPPADRWQRKSRGYPHRGRGRTPQSSGSSTTSSWAPSCRQRFARLCRDEGSSTTAVERTDAAQCTRHGFDVPPQKL